MRTALIVSALAALAAAAPRPQDIDFGEIDSEPRPTETGPSPTDVSDPVDYSLSAAKASASAAVTDDLTSGDSKRDLVELQSLVERAQGDCAPQPNGYGPKPATDTVDAFKSYQTFHVSNFVDEAGHPLTNLYRTLQTMLQPLLKATP